MASSKNRKWWGLAALMPALAMVFADQTILPVALPTIQKGLGATEVALQWSVNAYLLAIAVLVLVGGKLADGLGLRRAFIFGMALFVGSSALCGTSQHISWLIAARALQGVGAALMFPASTALLMSLFPPSERGRAVGINVSVSSLFMILGPLLGGYLVEHSSWRWIFYVNLPLGILGILLVLLFIPPSKEHTDKRGDRIDRPGFVYFTICSTALVVAMMEGREWGWDSWPILSLFGVTLLSGLFLVLREKKAAHPFLDLSLFKHPLYKAVNISIFAVQFILMITVFRAVFFQDALDWSPMKTGVVSFFSCTPVLFMSLLGGFLSDRFGPKLPIAVGYFCLVFSFFWTAFFIESSLPILLLGLCALGFGVPLVMTPSYASAMGAIPPDKAGTAFGTISTVRSLGSTVGVAVIGSLLDNIQHSAFRRIAPGEPASVLNQPVSSLPSSIASSVKAALFDGFFFTHILIGIALLVSFFFVFVLYKRHSLHRIPMPPAQGWD